MRLLNRFSQPDCIGIRNTAMLVAAIAAAACCANVAAASAEGVVHTIPVGSTPESVSSDGADVWVTNHGENTVSEIETASGTVIRTIPVPYPEAVSSDGTDVWVTGSTDATRTVSEIEASSGTVIRTIHLGREANAVSSDGTHVWVTNRGVDTVTEIPAGYSAECSADAGTITLSPGLTNTAAVQTMKLKGTLTGCAYEPFTSVKYTATLKTAAAVSCSVLKTAGEPASGAAKYTWTPKAKASTGILGLALAQAAETPFSGEVTSGSYVPLALSGVAIESYTGAATCGTKAVKKGTFSGSVSLLY